ncbi:alkaline phosphatase family protein [Margalitia sp. FSL K6-0131]|uniref:alkaline phosphatase family protein n=1 Tax=Margalitia sp. FSL K6-0131 TaxID=2954604 RepID=UPI0030F4CC9F
MASLQSPKKRVMLLMIDTLMDSALQAALNSGNVPAFQFFMESGCYYPNVVSPFPTMSVNVDSTLLTGVYCDKHNVPGLVWYNQKEKRIVNYGSHVRELYKLGLKQSVEDVFFNLNHVHLNQQHKTIHQILHNEGLKTSSINALLYKGNHPTILKTPFLLSKITGMERRMEVGSPELFSYGAFQWLNPVKKYASSWRKYGFNDKFSANEMGYLIKQNKLPNFTIVYFPDLDQSVHKNGRTDIKGIQKVDKQLQKILNQYSSWEEALTNNIWIISGDNGQSWISGNKKEALIDLRDLLSSYKIVKLKNGVTSQDEIVLGVNERMTFIYSLDNQKAPLQEIAKILKNDDRIDVIAIRNGKTITVTSGLHEGSLQFYPDGEFVDEYEQNWFLEGNTEILNLSITNKKVTYGDYPDALARLYSSFFSHEGEYLIVSAKPGYEFIGEGSPTHVGGASHGGLHKEDSLVSLIVSGTTSMPKHLRIIDYKNWILSMMVNCNNQ